jgi:hypothetical protein
MIWDLEFTGENQKLYYYSGMTLAISYFLKTYRELKRPAKLSYYHIITDITKYAGLVTLLSVLDDARFMYRLSSMRVLILFI